MSGLKCDTVVVLTRKVAPKKQSMIHFRPEMYHDGPLTEDGCHISGLKCDIVVVLTRKVILKKESMIHFRPEMYHDGPS